MGSYIIPYLFIIIAAAAKAVSDVVSFHYEDSIFSTRNPMFWNPKVSGNRPFVKIWFIKTKYRLDAWHMGYSAFVVGYALAFAFKYDAIFHSWLEVVVTIGLVGTIHILTFNLFYNKLLRK